MAALHPAVAATRGAVRDAIGPAAAGPLAGGPAGGLVLVACSGGADSLALAAAAAFVAPRAGWRAGLVTVDHQLQPGSAERALDVARWAAEADLSPAIIETVRVTGRPGGPEAAAREARYQALVRAATEQEASAVLLGHTRDDQAETVLLALLRGAGLRGIAGMPVHREIDGVTFIRPLLEISREQTRAACVALGYDAWDDPHNNDPAYGRTHARTLIGSLVDELGPSVVPNLARTAHLAAVDTAALDDLAAAAWSAAAADDGSLRVDDLLGLAEAVRTRVLHRWARWLGASGSALSHRHVAALAALLTDWHGQGPVYLPGAIAVIRRDGSLRRLG